MTRRLNRLCDRAQHPASLARELEDATIATDIGKGFRYAKDWYPHTVNHVKPHALLKPLIGKSDESDRGILDARFKLEGRLAGDLTCAFPQPASVVSRKIL